MRLRPRSLYPKVEGAHYVHAHLRRVTGHTLEAHHIVYPFCPLHHRNRDCGPLLRPGVELSAVRDALQLIVEDSAPAEDQSVEGDPKLRVPLVEVGSPIEVELSVARTLATLTFPRVGVHLTHGHASLRGERIDQPLLEAEGSEGVHHRGSTR